MTALAIGMSSAPWLRAIKIVGVFVVIGPLVASIGLFASHVIEGLSNARYAVTLESALRMWWSWAMISYMAGAPYALVTGAAFSLFAVFTRWSQWWVAVAMGLAPLPVIHLLPPIGAPLWEMPQLFVVTAIAVVVIASGVCWCLSRRWHGQAR